MNSSIRDTTLMRRMSALDMVYARVERAQTAFRETAMRHGSPISCPSLCGTCCLHFVPDAMPIEADRLAHFILTEKREMVDHFMARREKAEAIDAACPFWNPDTPGRNCMVYPARPLICRLFGFCSVLDKCGEPAFALCRQMPDIAGSDKRRFVGAATMERLFGAIPPLMLDFSRAIAALDPSDAGERTTIDQALPRALSRVSLVLRLAAASSENRLESEKGAKPEEDSNPDDFPIAS
ncbi:MAG TPA: YkgJ family cysteine cluster protein [Rectinemataceae bacterium]|nr:YkgJ family cysteine cluster protein [Rectinemataceae bacterium]